MNSSLINNQNSNLDNSIGNDSSIDLNDKSISSSLFKSQQQSQYSKLNILSRRPSYASIADSETSRNYFMQKKYFFKNNIFKTLYI